MEIERKYLINYVPKDIDNYPSKNLVQAYVSFDPTIRIRKSDNNYYLTVKGPGEIAREEFEIPITECEFNSLMKKTEGTPIHKKRYYYPIKNNLIAELDVYQNNLLNLVTVEVEFATMDDEMCFIPPKWFGKDVSHDKNYKNTNLSRNGFPL